MQFHTLKIMNVPECMIESPASKPKVDRLAAFFDAFQLTVRVLFQPEVHHGPALYILSSVGIAAESIVLCVRGGGALPSPPLIAAAVDFGSTNNPLLNAMPDCLSMLVTEDSALRDTTNAFMAEALGARCGRTRALDRLGEVIVLMALRKAIDSGSTEPGLLAGLGHPHLHRVLVALHESPARAWDTGDLADVAGMSRSSFMALFPKVVGVTPMVYLNRWRLQFGRRKLLKGEKVKAVARGAGFASAEAFSRAYSREFGRPPVADMRPSGFADASSPVASHQEHVRDPRESERSQ